MKKLFIIFVMIFTLVSCGGGTQDSIEEIKVEEKGDLQEAGEIIDGYLDTLETSVEDAKEVKDIMEKRQEAFK